MSYCNTQFKVEQLRQVNVQRVLESMAVILFAIFVAALLPSLLICYVYASQQLLEQTKVLDYIPLAAFVAGAAYFIFMVIGNTMRELRARQLEKELMNMHCDCSGCDLCDDEMMDMSEMEAIAEKAVKSSAKKKKSSKK